MRNKVSMWLLLVSSYLMQIPFLVYFIAGMINEELTNSGLFIGLIVALSCILALVTLVLCAVNIFGAALGLNKNIPVPYKTTMLVKLCMIPFYVINFVIWGMFIAVCILFPYLILFGILLFVISIISTYLTVLATGAGNIVYAIKDVKRTKSALVILCIIGHFIFCLDVIAAIILYAKDKTEQVGAETVGKL